MQESMQNKFLLSVVLISIVMAGVFVAQWFRDQNRVHSLVIATGERNGEYY